MKVARMLVVMAGLVMTFGGATMADDVMPPPWGGMLNSQWAEWDTWNGGMAGDIPSDIFSANPQTLGPPVARSSGQYLGQFQGRLDVIEMNQHDDLTFMLDNFDDPNPEKRIWLQVTYWIGLEMTPETSFFGVNLWLPSSPTDPIFVPAFPGSPNFITRVEHIDDITRELTGWATDVYEFIIQPNPDWEQIGLKFDAYPAYVDQVVIDTICVPEPATMGMLAIGAGMFVRRRRG